MSSSGGDWPAGFGLRQLDSIDSTNAEAARMAASVRMPTWVTARVQTAGRGRRGRVWATPEGALAASLLMFPAQGPEQAALRSFVAALALAEAFESLGAPRAAVFLKWPNDVLLFDCKVAGILLEAAGAGRQLDHLIIGIGVNLNTEPDAAQLEESAIAPISLAQVLGRPVASDDMLAALAGAYANWEARFEAEGFDPIRSAWLTRAARLGDVITARTLRESHTGTFETVDTTGNLVLRTASARVTIPAADVFF